MDLFAILLRLVRSWVCRYPLFDGQGNFGSLDGDPPAGMRYTELARFRDEDPPIPRLLCNGAWAHSGSYEPGPDPEAWNEDALMDGVPEEPIRGGELLSFLPPHNLGEVARALRLLHDQPKATLDDVLRVLPGPDFPTGGVLVDPEGLPKLYASGEGELRVRSRVSVDTLPKDKFCVVISEVPYGMSKKELIERVAGAVKEGRMTDIRDVRDVSYKETLRVEIETSRGKDPAWVVHQLESNPDLDSVLPVRMVIRRDGKETRVNLMDLLRLALDRLPRDPRKTLSRWRRRSDARRTSIS